MFLAVLVPSRDKVTAFPEQPPTVLANGPVLLRGVPCSLYGTQWYEVAQGYGVQCINVCSMATSTMQEVFIFLGRAMSRKESRHAPNVRAQRRKPVGWT